MNKNHIMVWLKILELLIKIALLIKEKDTFVVIGCKDLVV